MTQTLTITDALQERITAYHAQGRAMAAAEDSGNYPTADQWEYHDTEARDILDQITTTAQETP